MAWLKYLALRIYFSLFGICENPDGWMDFEIFYNMQIPDSPVPLSSDEESVGGIEGEEDWEKVE